MEQNREALEARIGEGLEELGNLDEKSEEYQKVEKSVKDLYSLEQEDYKLNMEAYTRDENLEMEKAKIEIDKERLELDKAKFKDSKRWFNRIPWNVVETGLKLVGCATALYVTKKLEENEGMRMELGASGRNMIPKL